MGDTALGIAMIDGDSPAHWRDLQERVARILRECGFEADVDQLERPRRPGEAGHLDVAVAVVVHPDLGGALLHGGEVLGREVGAQLAQHVDEDLIGQDVQFLLVFALDVGGARQAEDAGELEDLGSRLAQADVAVAAQKGASCCYAKSDKYWTLDPQGIAWESFRTLGDVPVYGEDGRAKLKEAQGRSACCAVG